MAENTNEQIMTNPKCGCLTLRFTMLQINNKKPPSADSRGRNVSCHGTTDPTESYQTSKSRLTFWFSPSVSISLSFDILHVSICWCWNILNAIKRTYLYHLTNIRKPAFYICWYHFKYISTTSSLASPFPAMAPWWRWSRPDPGPKAPRTSTNPWDHWEHLGSTGWPGKKTMFFFLKVMGEGVGKWCLMVPYGSFIPFSDHKDETWIISESRSFCW